MGSLNSTITSTSLSLVCSPRTYEPNKAMLATGYFFGYNLCLPLTWLRFRPLSWYEGKEKPGVTIFAKTNLI